MIALIINPTSGSGRGKRLGQEWISELSRREIPFEIIENPTLEESINQLRWGLSQSRFTKIVSIGGDGLAHHLFTDAIASEVPLMIVPAGTGNDFARSSGTFRKSTLALIQSLETHSPQKVDMSLLEFSGKSKWYGQVLSSGFDSRVNARANQMRFNLGRAKYVFAMLAELATFVPQKYELIIDGKNEEFSAMVLAVGNGANYGGGMMVCPGADRHDGLLDVMVLRKVPMLKFLRIFPLVFTGKHVRYDEVTILRARKIEILKGAVIYADGEFISDPPISITCIPGALSTWIL